MSFIAKLSRFISNRVKDIPSLEVILNPQSRWLYKNRYLRMDANEAINRADRREFHLDRYRFVSNYLIKTIIPGSAVLDAACGTGYGSRLLQDMGFKVTGVDIDLEAIAYADKTYGSPRCDFKVADVVRMEGIEDGTFAAVVSFETIEHLEKPQDSLSAISRVLKKNGWLIISTPNKWGPTRDHRFDYDYDLFRSHLEQFFTIEEMYTQNSGCMDLWVNRGAPRRLVKAAPDNIEQAECFLAVCRKK